jgi:hypothetical protein
VESLGYLFHACDQQEAQAATPDYFAITSTFYANNRRICYCASTKVKNLKKQLCDIFEMTLFLTGALIWNQLWLCVKLVHGFHIQRRIPWNI